MPNIVTNLAKETMISAVSGSDLKIALLNGIASSGTEEDLKNFGAWSDLSAYEITGEGYDPGGVTLSGTSAYSVSADEKAYFNGSSITWPDSTISTYGYALYRSTSGLVVNITAFNSPLPKTSTNGPFTMSWDNNRILQMIG